MAQPFNLFAPRPVVAAQQVINGDLNKIQQQAAEAQQRAQQTMQQPVVNAQPQVTPTPKPTEVAQKQQQTYTGGSNNPLGAMDYLNQYTTPEQEEKYRKASVQRQRILAVADALRHIGNIYNTTKYAPAQQFNSPVEMERNRYLQDKALRDKDNYKIMTYQQAKAAQELRAKQLEQKQNQWQADYGLKVADAARKAGYTDAQIKAMQDRIANQKAYNDRIAGIRENALKETIRAHRASEGQRAQGLKMQRERTNAYVESKRNGGGSRGTATYHSPYGSYSKGASAQEVGSITNQLYERLRNTKGADGKPIIDEGGILAGMPDDGLFGKKVSLQDRKKAVDKALWEHPEVAEMLSNDYGFTFTSNGKQKPVQQQPAQVNTNFAPWNNNAVQYPSSTYEPGYSDDEIEDMFDDDDLSDINI